MNEKDKESCTPVRGVITGSLETRFFARGKDVGAGALALDVGGSEGPTVPLGLLLRLLVPLNTESRAVLVIAVGPAVRDACVVQGPNAVCRPAVEEFVVGEGEVGVVGGVGQMASSERCDAIAIAAGRYETA